MPKNKFQEVIFTIIMVFVMVYAMICYNIVLNTGTMTNETFLLAFHELTFMGPIAFILDFFIIGGLAKKIAFGIVDMRRDNPFHLVLAISAVSVAFMCPCMSFAATVLIKHAPASQIIPTWLQTTAATRLGSTPTKFPVLDASGWIYYRTADDLKTDLGIPSLSGYATQAYVTQQIQAAINETWEASY